MDRNFAAILFLPARDTGQARKSLWIETDRIDDTVTLCVVRLVRACGSKQEQLWKEIEKENKGQARKSLWIETAPGVIGTQKQAYGQARKSLWIETKFSRLIKIT